MILPWFLNIVSSFPWSKIPESTQILMNINSYLEHNWNSLLIWVIIFLLVIWLFVSTEDGRKFFSGLFVKIPLVGKIFRLYYVVYFLRYFSLLIYSWLPITKVFLYLKWVMTNPFYKQMCDEIIIKLNKWESFIPVMKNYTHIIPSDVIVLIKVWEETANLQEAAKNAIWLYEEEFNKIVDNLSKIIEPILILFVGGIIWFVALSLFSMVTGVLDSLQT